MGIVSVNRLKAYGYHGCLPEEAVIGTWFLVDMDVEYDFEEAARKDDLNRTVDYVTLCKIAQEEIAIRAKLIENVAWRIIQRIRSEYPEAGKIKITLFKENPPANASLDTVSVTLEDAGKIKN